MMKKLPLAYEIQTTNRCNGRCIICPHCNQKRPQADMSMELFEKIIDDIASLGTDDIRLILYLNGEPFLDPYFLERLRYARRKCQGAEIEISSNLSMLSREIIETMAECKVTDFRISCFGFTRESYHYVMPGLNFDIFMNNMESLLEYVKKDLFKGEVSLTMINYPELLKEDYDLAKEFCDKNGILFNFWGFLDRTDNVKKYSNHVHISKEAEEEKLYTCAQHRHIERMHILADGRVPLCCQDWQEKNIMGSLKDNMITEIWENERYQLVRKQIDEKGYRYPDICKKCKILLEGIKV